MPRNEGLPPAANGGDKGCPFGVADRPASTSLRALLALRIASLSRTLLAFTWAAGAPFSGAFEGSASVHALPPYSKPAAFRPSHEARHRAPPWRGASAMCRSEHLPQGRQDPAHRLSSGGCERSGRSELAPARFGPCRTSETHAALAFSPVCPARKVGVSASNLRGCQNDRYHAAARHPCECSSDRQPRAR